MKQRHLKQGTVRVEAVPATAFAEYQTQDHFLPCVLKKTELVDYRISWRPDYMKLFN